jgi:TrbL/VirB6 plasmid conjugal transfer protein
LNIRTLILLGLLIALCPQFAFADTDVGSSISTIAAVVDKLESVFVSKGNAAAAALIPFALKVLAGAFALMLSWLTLQWFFESRPLASLFGTFLNVSLRMAIITALLIPVAGTSGYSTATGLVTQAADAVTTAVGGDEYKKASSVITNGGGALVRTGFEALVNIFNSAKVAKDAAPATSLWDINPTALVQSILMPLVTVIVGLVLLVCMAYALFNLTKVILYGVVAFSLGTAVGPFFIAMLFLPITANIGMHWFGFMLVACFLKVVAAFILSAVVSNVSTLLPVHSATAAASYGDRMDQIMIALFALMLIYVVVGWLLGSAISLANALLPGSIGQPGGLSVLSAAVGAVAGAAAATAAAAKTAVGNAKAAAGGSGSGLVSAIGGQAGGSSGGASPQGGGGGSSGGGGAPPIGQAISGNIPAASQGSTKSNLISSLNSGASSNNASAFTPSAGSSMGGAPTGASKSAPVTSSGVPPLSGGEATSGLVSSVGGSPNGVLKELALGAGKIATGAAQGAMSGSVGKAVTSGWKIGSMGGPGKAGKAESPASEQTPLSAARAQYSSNVAASAAGAFKDRTNQSMSPEMKEQAKRTAQAKFDKKSPQVQARYTRMVQNAARPRDSLRGTATSASPAPTTSSSTSSSGATSSASASAEGISEARSQFASNQVRQARKDFSSKVEGGRLSEPMARKAMDNAESKFDSKSPQVQARYTAMSQSREERSSVQKQPSNASGSGSAPDSVTPNTDAAKKP